MSGLKPMCYRKGAHLRSHLRVGEEVPTFSPLGVRLTGSVTLTGWPVPACRIELARATPNPETWGPPKGQTGLLWLTPRVLDHPTIVGKVGAPPHSPPVSRRRRCQCCEARHGLTDAAAGHRDPPSAASRCFARRGPSTQRGRRWSRIRVPSLVGCRFASSERVYLGCHERSHGTPRVG